MMRYLVRALVLLAALCGGSLPALAQSGCSYIATGAVLTAAQWNQCFAQKQNALGYTAVNRAGDTMLGRLTVVASTTGGASINIPPGVAPTSPSNGDMWSTSSGLFVRVNGVTIGPLNVGASGSSFAATTPLTVSFPSSVVTYSLQVAAVSLLGNPTGSLANGSGITLGSTLSFSGTTLNCTTATSAQIGCARPDNSTITISGGVMSAIGGVATSVQVGVTTIVSGTTTRILRNNAGVLGEYSISGTGNVVMSSSALMTDLIIRPAAGTGTLTIQDGGPTTTGTLSHTGSLLKLSVNATTPIELTAGTGGGLSNQIFLSGAGANFVGINTGSPSANFHAKGTIRFEDVNCSGTGGTATVSSTGVVGCTTTSSARTKLVAAQTFFVRKDGSDSNTCLTDSAGGACLTFQAAINKALAFDFGGQSQTVKRGSDAGVGTFTENITIVNCVGGGDLSITGVPTSFATATNTVLTSASGTTISVSFCPTNVRIGGLTISCNSGSGRGIFAGYQGTVTITTFIRFGSCDQQMINHDLQGLIQALSISVEIFGGGSCHICNGGQLFYESVAMTLTSTPQFNVAWLSCSAGKVQTSSLSTVSGSAIGFRYKLYNNCGVDTVGQDADSVFPGSNTLGPFGSASIGNKPTALGIYDSGSLPACNVNWQGTIAFVYSASNAGTWSSTIAGGGGAAYLAWCNGSAWTEVGK